MGKIDRQMKSFEGLQRKQQKALAEYERQKKYKEMKKEKSNEQI